ncbi:MAG TPA: LysR substrate-binding domain-containing protein [Roseovarius sp.]
MRFTLRQLSYFVAAGEAGSVTRAAETINISQPSVSSAISHLEEELGVQLFIRQHAQGLVLTPSGKRLLKAAKESLRAAHRLYEVAGETASLVAGPLHIGAFHTFAPLILPEIWRSFSDLYPDVQLKVTTASEAELAEGLRRAQIDVALTYESQLSSEIVFHPLARMPTYVLLAADHPLAARASLSLADLAQEPFVLLDLPISRQYFISLFEQSGQKPHIVAECADPSMLRSFVAAGIGFSLMTSRPANMRAETMRPLAYVPLERIGDDAASMTVGLAMLRDMHSTRLLDAFRQHCEGAVRTGAIPGMCA